jgi:hypothetical protein
VVNNRKFTLLGDPALKMAFPANNIITTKVKGLPVSRRDALKAFSQYKYLEP